MPLHLLLAGLALLIGCSGKGTSNEPPAGRRYTENPAVADATALANCKASGRTFQISMDESSTGLTCEHPKPAFVAADVCAWGVALQRLFPYAEIRVFTEVSLFAVDGFVSSALGLAKAGVRMRTFADYQSNVWSFESNGENKEYCVEELGPNQYQLRLVSWSVP